MEWAGRKETTVVGSIGATLFSFLSVFALFGLYRAPSVLLTKLFFFSILLSSVLDLPRYIMMISDGKYHSTAGYASHIISNYFFFLSLTLVCVVWAHLLESGTYSAIFFKGYGAVVTNLILIVVSLVTFSYCVDANSLKSFIKSDAYITYIFFEVTENLFYSLLVAFLGLKLVYRFQNYTSSGTGNKAQAVAFRKAQQKVALTLALNAICSTIRILLLLFFVFHSVVIDIDSIYFRKYGVIWFLWSDFLPKGIASLAFMNLMASRPQQSQKHSNQSTHQPSWSLNLNELELERTPTPWGFSRESNTEIRMSDVEVMNPISEEPQEQDAIPTSLDDRLSQASSFWDSPTAAQDALRKITISID